MMTVAMTVAVGVGDPVADEWASRDDLMCAMRGGRFAVHDAEEICIATGTASGRDEFRHGFHFGAISFR